MQPGLNRTNGPLGYFTQHRTLANLLLLLMLGAGIAALPNMRAQFFPDVIVESVSVSVTWDGAGAEDVDRGIVQVLEPALLAIEGVESAESVSREGRAVLALEFEPGWDMARAADDVQSAVESVTDLPDDSDQPEVRRGAWRDRVTDVVISGPVGLEQLGRYADEFVARLFAAGVTRTTVRGLTAPRTVVEVPSASLVAHDLEMSEIAAAIGAETDAGPAGEVAAANSRIRTGSEKRSPAKIASIVLRTDSDGRALTVGDVADVRVEGGDREERLFVGTSPAIAIRVDRSDKGDAIGIQRRVERVAQELVATLPQGVEVRLVRTRSEAIEGRLNMLLENGAQGLGLVLLLLFAFLNARTAFWVAAGIPTAMLAAVALMYLFGITFNMISLFALIITLGIVVDDAIVVGEHADHRFRQYGEPPAVAAENAARRMLQPVLAATVTTVIAFFGLVAIGGRFGDLIADIPLTVIMVLLASLAECFLVLPNHMAHALAHAGKRHFYDLPSRVVNAGFVWLRERLFRPFVARVIGLRYPVIAGAVAILASQAALVVDGTVKWRFFNAPERSSITGNFAMLDGATRADALAMMREMQRAAGELGRDYEARYGRNPISFAMAQVGGNAGRHLAGSDTKSPDLLGGISIELIDPDLRPYSSFAFVAELQDRVQRHPLVETVSFRGWRSGPGGDALDVEFYGASSAVLKAAAEDLKRALSRYPEVSAVEDNLAYDKDELILELTPQGRTLGFDTEGLGRVLRDRLSGIEAARYPDGPRSATIQVRLPEKELTADFLERVLMRTPLGNWVPLSDIVRVERRSGFSTVRRENGIRLVSVTGDISEDDPARAVEINRALEDKILPKIAAERQVTYRLGGLGEQEDAFLRDARDALLMVLGGIYLVLAWVFASWSRPLVIMAIIPFGLVGTIWGHNFHGVPMSMFTVVGLLGLTGIIINDSIVLITQIDRHASGRGLIPAVVEGAVDRLRAVFLTSATTVLGLAPLLFERSVQAQFLKPTVITLVYGLGFGVFLVLLIVPAAVAIQADFAGLARAYRRGIGRRGQGSIRVVLAIATVAVAGWLGLTVGAVAVSGALPKTVVWLAPSLAGFAPMAAALVLFLVGGAAMLVLIFALAALFLTVVPKQDEAAT